MEAGQRKPKLAQESSLQVIGISRVVAGCKMSDWDDAWSREFIVGNLLHGKFLGFNDDAGRSIEICVQLSLSGSISDCTRGLPDDKKDEVIASRESDEQGLCEVENRFHDRHSHGPNRVDSSATCGTSC